METIGDAYMVVGGVPVPTADHAERVARFAMDIVGEAANVPSPATGKPLQVSSEQVLNLTFPGTFSTRASLSR